MIEDGSLFTYGTLMVPEIISSLLKRPLEGEPVTLLRYRRGLIRHERYPGILPSEKHSVSGVLYRNISSHEFQILNDYEGDLYQLEVVDVSHENRQQQERAFSYVLKMEFSRLLTEVEWSLDHFILHDLDSFLTGYQGFQNKD
ncbi:MAG: gamma-glutamylcyclotransferase [Saprospiraceae bacterium]|nr:gamma-glutamylcyclotransferase [Saprospiraceae bacterium]